MNLLSTESLSKAYGEKKLFDKVAFGIDDSDKIGLIGINGTGKTSFLKVIAGIDEADAGSFIKSSNLKIEYLAQNPKKEEPMEDYTGKIPKLHMADEAGQWVTDRFIGKTWVSGRGTSTFWPIKFDTYKPVGERILNSFRLK